MAVLLQGFLLGLSLILAIGAQNAFVFRVGLNGRHIFWVCLFCALSDASLIVLGVSGTGNLLAQYEGATRWLYLGAAAWLGAYGVLRIRAAMGGQPALGGQSALKASDDKAEGLGATLLVAAGLTWLNPHVYLDTVVLLGGISATIEADMRAIFGLGAALASCVFFFALGYGAKALGGRLTNPKTWTWIDLGIAVVMFWLAGGLLWAAILG